MSNISSIPPNSDLIKKLRWWQDLKFGLFIHWGIYSVWGAVESWPIVDEEPYGRDSLEQWKQSGCDAEKFMQMYFDQNLQFDPKKFAPERWALAARNAGMKYVVFTTRHHDGFCMYDSKYSDYRITSDSCPFHSSHHPDITKRVFDAFRKYDFGIGVYYSKADWHHFDYWAPDKPRRSKYVNYDNNAQSDKWARYQQYVYNQIEELLTGYGRVDILWLDSDWVSAPKEDIKMARIADMARKAQPGILIVDRNVGGKYENYRTPELKVPDYPPDYPWETCMTMAQQWSYKPNDIYKSTRELIHLLVNIVAKGGNLLLNIGPNAEGEFDKQAENRLADISKWMKVNSSAIYLTRAVAPFKAGNLCVAAKGDLTYVFYLAEDGQETMPENIKVDFIEKAAQVRLLGSESVVNHRCDQEGLTIDVPPKSILNPPCKYAWVFEIVDAEIKLNLSRSGHCRQDKP